MVRVLVVGSEHEIRVRKPLIQVTNGVSLVTSPCGLTEGERKEDNIHKYPLNIPLRKWFAFNQDVHLSDSE
jgi:hypothetical protein